MVPRPQLKCDPMDTNVMEELMEASEGRTIKAATLTLENGWGEAGAVVELRVNGDHSDFWRALSNLRYDSGYGTQYLFGAVWFTDGTWLERHEYDGAESWRLKFVPAIPERLRANP